MQGVVYESIEIFLKVPKLNKILFVDREIRATESTIGTLTVELADLCLKFFGTLRTLDSDYGIATYICECNPSVRRFLSKRTPARIKTVPKSSAIVALIRSHIPCRREPAAMFGKTLVHVSFYRSNIFRRI